MDATTAFENRKEALRAQLEEAKDAAQTAAACTMALEQIACELAQDEQDEQSRQRQQAVLALSRHATAFLSPARAQGRLVLDAADRQQPNQRNYEGKSAWDYMQIAGALLLCALAVYELVAGRMFFVLMQAAGAILLLMGSAKRPQAMRQPAQMHAEGVLVYDAAQTLRAIGELCQAVDVCVSDLALISGDSASVRLSGTVDEATLDLLCALMEAKASGRENVAMRSLSQVEQYLHMLGLEPVFYDAQHAALFDLLPTLGEGRTVRPALLRDGKLLRRGVAACRMERSVGA